MKASSKGIEVICALDTNTPVRVRGDGDRLKQVVLNLLSNAIKFTQSGEVEVRIELESETAMHQVIKVSVRDTGIGIPQEAQAKLFTRFSQVDSSTTRNYGGTGLGLAISKQLVELMSGTIGVTSASGAGSTFWFSVVLEKAESLSEEKRRLPSESCPILVVSHNTSACNVLAGYLETWGADVSTAVDENEAQIYLSARSVDTVIVSLSLPEYTLEAVEPIMSFIAASITKVRFWIVLCPINFVGKMRRFVADMAETFATKDEMRAAHVAWGIVIISQPVRQAVLYDCLAKVPRETRETYGTGSCVSHKRSLKSADSNVVDIETGDTGARRQMQTTAIQVMAEGSISRGCHPKSWTTERTSYHVLLVDDNSTSQQAMRTIIRNVGMLCDVAGNGKEALSAIARASYDLVLMDLVMPEMDGSTATKLLREREAELSLDRLPVIGVSATISSRQACIAAGMDGCIQKPIGGAELLDIVQTILQPSDEISIPIDVSESVDDVISVGPVVFNSEIDVPRPSFKVLVAEDSEANQMAIRRMLSKQGAEVTVVADGSEAVDLVVKQNVRYNLAIFDICMPIMGGVEAMHHIRRSLHIDLPVIALSANVDKVQLQSYLDEGFSMVLTKPLKVSMCREILAKYGHVVSPDPSTCQTTALHAPRDSATSISSGTSGNSSFARSSWTGMEDSCPVGRSTSTKQYLVLIVEDNGGITPCGR
jgi:CheY-like chemotaxis protein